MLGKNVVFVDFGGGFRSEAAGLTPALPEVQPLMSERKSRSCLTAVFHHDLRRSSLGGGHCLYHSSGSLTDISLIGFQGWLRPKL